MEFAGSRFTHYMHVYATGARKGGLLAGPPHARDAWHLFETHLQLHRTREGKKYKEWLTTRADKSDARAGMESGATLIIRSAVRDYLHGEGPRRMTESLDAGLCRDGDGNILTLFDLLPAEQEGYSGQQECDALAPQIADKVFAALVHREKVALLARQLDIALSSPAATEAAGCAKSMLSVAFMTGLERVAETARACCPGEDRESLAALAVSVFEVVRQRVMEWGRSETCCLSLYMSRKGRSDMPGART